MGEEGRGVHGEGRERQSAGGNETEQGDGRWEERISGKTKSKAKSFFEVSTEKTLRFISILLYDSKPLAQSRVGIQNPPFVCRRKLHWLFTWTMDFRVSFPVISFLPSVMHQLGLPQISPQPSTICSPPPHGSGQRINSPCMC